MTVPSTEGEPMPNVPLLTKTLDHVVAHPEELDSRIWLCGTTGCFAGHASLIDGGRSVQIEDGYGALLHAVPEDDPADVLVIGGTGVVSVRNRARRILGLSRPDAKRLFKGSNTLDDLRRIVGELCEGETP